MLDKKHCTAIILAAGNGSRMKSSVAKQFLLLEGKPLIWYSLQTMEQSGVIDECILVTGQVDVAYVQKEIVEKYQFTKVSHVAVGGRERYDSVAHALAWVTQQDGYVFIHDGARPFVTEEMLQSLYEEVDRYHAVVAAVPCKDTIKIGDEQGFVEATPNRSRMWNVQTPQVFDTQIAVKAYGQLMHELEEKPEQVLAVTDDASVVERFTDNRVKLVMGSYCNIKITTPEDMKTAEAFLHP